MKKNETPIGRILGRKLARELTREELEKATGSGPKTTTLRYPPDQDQIDSGE
ncbi:MAG TPA: hypothetical protein VLT87_11575 [Thermoanaerobaculia bacterium]|nr:hypothetical protein [Thermoanaerobaculia bacterium]